MVITRFDDQPAARVFKNKLERRGIRVYTHRATTGYPTDVDLIVSDEGYGANRFIETDQAARRRHRRPGPGSGKLATCLSQLYHEHRAGVNAGYAKFETFPIWNLPLKHPVNVAYEAATADLARLQPDRPVPPRGVRRDGGQLQPRRRGLPGAAAHPRADPRRRRLYQSPTDMGVNRAGFGIVDDEAVREAAKQEVDPPLLPLRVRVRSWASSNTRDRAARRAAHGGTGRRGRGPRGRRARAPTPRSEAEDTGKGNDGIYCGAAIELADGTIVTGKNSPLMHAASSLVLNAVKHLAGIPDAIHLLSPTIDRRRSRTSRRTSCRRARSASTSRRR